MVLRHSLIAMEKYLLKSFTVILLVLTILVGRTFLNRWTMPFNYEGNYFDQNINVVYHEQSVLIYGIATFFLAMLTVFIAFLARKKSN